MSVEKITPQSPNMEKYYSLRKAVRKLYDNDVYYGDLCGSILHIRDKNRCINSMSTKIQDHIISVDFDDNTDQKKKNKIVNEVVDNIGKFIGNNANVLSTMTNISENELLEFSQSETKKFCDAQLVGNNLTILL